MHKGDLGEASSIFLSILDEDPEDVIALNAMGIISFVVDNNNDANYYFSKAIDSHPNNTIGYKNRSQLYKYQKDYKNAISDMTMAINIDPAQPDLYFLRGIMYADQNQWKDATKDYTKAMESDDFKKDPNAYFYRAISNAADGNFVAARNDVQSAYNLTNDPEMEAALQQLWKNLY